MMLSDRLKMMAEKLADWLDDRWTWAAIGLLTGYFGFGSSDAVEWLAWQEVGIAVASLVLILVRDQNRRSSPSSTDESGYTDRSNEVEHDHDDVPSKPAAVPRSREAVPPLVDHHAAERVRPLPPRTGPVPVQSRRPSNTTEASDVHSGWGDRD